MRRSELHRCLPRGGRWVRRRSRRRRMRGPARAKTNSVAETSIQPARRNVYGWASPWGKLPGIAGVMRDPARAKQTRLLKLHSSPRSDVHGWASPWGKLPGFAGVMRDPARAKQTWLLKLHLVPLRDPSFVRLRLPPSPVGKATRALPARAKTNSVAETTFQHRRGGACSSRIRHRPVGRSFSRHPEHTTKGRLAKDLIPIIIHSVNLIWKRFFAARKGGRSE